MGCGASKLLVAAEHDRASAAERDRASAAEHDRASAAERERAGNERLLRAELQLGAEQILELSVRCAAEAMKLTEAMKEEVKALKAGAGDGLRSVSGRTSSSRTGSSNSRVASGTSGTQVTHRAKQRLFGRI